LGLTPVSAASPLSLAWGLHWEAGPYLLGGRPLFLMWPLRAEESCTKTAPQQLCGPKELCQMLH